MTSQQTARVFLYNDIHRMYNIIGRTVFHYNYYRDFMIGKSHARPQQRQPPQAVRPSSVSGKPFSYIGSQARRLFLDNILRRVTNTLASDLSRRAAQQLFCGNSQPFFALVGVSLASGTGIITQQNAFEAVCSEIRVIFLKFHKIFHFSVSYMARLWY